MAADQFRILVTGATGFLGARLARRLVEDGHAIRALARERSDVSALAKLGAEIVFGDIVDSESVVKAVRGIDVVVHAAATRGTEQDPNDATVRGTRNILEACRGTKVKELIYISSCSVYELASHAEADIVTEEAQLERYPERRGPYSSAKQQAEVLVRHAMNASSYSIVALRPGTMYGRGAEPYTGMVGLKFADRVFMVFGDGRSELPLVHVENVVDAIVASIGNPTAHKQVFNVVDSDRVTKRMYMDRIVKPRHPKAIVIYCPFLLLLTVTWLHEKAAAILGRDPLLTVYRLVTSQRSVRYSTSKIEKAIGWRPRISFEQATQQLSEEQLGFRDEV